MIGFEDTMNRPVDNPLGPMFFAFVVAVVGIVGLLVIEFPSRNESHRSDFGDITGSVAAKAGATVRPTDPYQETYPW